MSVFHGVDCRAFLPQVALFSKNIVMVKKIHLKILNTTAKSEPQFLYASSTTAYSFAQFSNASSVFKSLNTLFFSQTVIISHIINRFFCGWFSAWWHSYIQAKWWNMHCFQQKIQRWIFLNLNFSRLKIV